MKKAINIEYPPLSQKYVSHNVQITSGVPSKREDKIKANSSELDIQHQEAIPSLKVFKKLYKIIHIHREVISHKLII